MPRLPAGSHLPGGPDRLLKGGSHEEQTQDVPVEADGEEAGPAAGPVRVQGQGRLAGGDLSPGPASQASQESQEEAAGRIPVLRVDASGVASGKARRCHGHRGKSLPGVVWVGSGRDRGL